MIKKILSICCFAFAASEASAFEWNLDSVFVPSNASGMEAEGNLEGGDTVMTGIGMRAYKDRITTLQLRGKRLVQSGSGLALTGSTIYGHFGSNPYHSLEANANCRSGDVVGAIGARAKNSNITHIVLQCFELNSNSKTINLDSQYEVIATLSGYSGRMIELNVDLSSFVSTSLRNKTFYSGYGASSYRNNVNKARAFWKTLN